MKHAVMFAGIDGSGKSSCMSLLIQKLGKELKIVTIGVEGPTLYFQGKKIPAVKAPGFSWLLRARPQIQRLHLMALFLPIKFFYNYFLSLYVELFKRYDVLIHETDVLVQPVVYLGLHIPATKKVAIGWRLRFFSLLRGSHKNSLVFFLDTEPEVAMPRLLGRGGALDDHENIDSLEQLKKDFDEVLGVAEKSGYQIFRVNTNNRPLDDVADEVCSILEGHAGDALQNRSYDNI